MNEADRIVYAAYQEMKHDEAVVSMISSAVMLVGIAVLVILFFT